MKNEKKDYTVKDLKGKPSKNRPYNVHYKFTEEEIKLKSSDLATNNLEKVRLEDKKKEVMSDYKAKIDKVVADTNLLARQVNSGYEMRDISCDVYLNQPIEGQKVIVRTDTNEIHKIEEMEAHEFQEPIPFEEDNKTYQEGEMTILPTDQKIIKKPKKERTKKNAK